MKKFIKVFSVFIAFTIFIPIMCQAQESGLLLGLRYYKTAVKKLPLCESKDAIKEPVYRTLWIAPDKGALRLIERSDLLVPRKSGFWRIGIQRNIYNTWIEDLIWTAPVDREPVMKEIDPSINECEGNTRFTILFVGNDYVSLEKGSDGYCEGAVHPWHHNSLVVLPLNNLENKPVNISELTSNNVSEALKQGARAYLDNLDKDTRDTLETEPSQESWGLIRHKGQWVLRGRLGYSAEVYRGTYADFSIPLPPPTTLVSHDALFPSWNTIKEKLPDAVDAFSSPKKDLLVVLTRSTLLVFTVSNSKFDKPAMRLKLNEQESAVMAQWATGKYVERWTQQVNTLLRP